MRQAFSDTGWLMNDANELMGFALGYDFCSEHEHGVPYLKDNLGIPQNPFPIGVEDRTMTLVPEHMGFAKYEWRSRDKRFRNTIPSAVLHLSRATEYESDMPSDGLALARWLGVDFTFDSLASKRPSHPERDDIVCNWGESDGFAINVRGADNVAKLEALHQAMTECRVSVADPSVTGFLRKSLALVIVDALSPELCSNVRAADEAHFRLYQALEKSGVQAALKAAGLRWYGMLPAWRTEEGSELLIYLNPQDQRKYNGGWFTVPELMAWSHGNGPVITDPVLVEKIRALDVDMGFHLTKGLRDFGLALRTHDVPVWVDPDKTIIGMRLLMSAGSQDTMADGIYTLAQLEKYLDRGRALHAKERGEQYLAQQSAAKVAPLAMAPDSKALD